MDIEKKARKEIIFMKQAREKDPDLAKLLNALEKSKSIVHKPGRSFRRSRYKNHD